jgi:hypothetical protein
VRRWEDGLPNETKPNEPIRVTDKRIFTADGDLKDEYRDQVKPADPDQQKRPETESSEGSVASQVTSDPPQKDIKPDQRFLMLLDLVAANLSNALEMARRGAPEGREASNQLIDILDVIDEKTAGNLAAEEAQSLRALTGEAKLRFVQLTKDIKV